MRDNWVIKVKRWYILDLIKNKIHYYAHQLHNLPETPEIPEYEEGDDYDEWREEMQDHDKISQARLPRLTQLNKYVRLYEVARRTPDTSPEMEGCMWAVDVIDLDKSDIKFFGLSIEEIQKHAIGTGYAGETHHGY